MTSLAFLLASLALIIVLTALALAWTARLIGSVHGRFRHGMTAALLLTGPNAASWAVERVLPFQSQEAITFASAALLIANVGLAFALIGLVFRLSFWRTFVPFGGLVGIQLCTLVVVFLIFYPLIAQSFVLPSNSMSPTLETGDRFVVNKLLEPRRWDIVVYKSRANQDMIFCQRLVGLPGERLRFEAGQLYIDDEPTDVPQVLEGRCTLPSIRARSRLDQVHYQEGQTIVLGPDDYFFMGDNVDRSADSRLFGPSTGNSIVGVIDLVYWPPKHARVLR